MIQMSEEKLVPKLRFSGFDDEWETKKLSDVSIINPKTKNLSNDFVYIDLESVENGILTKISKISIDDAPSRAQRLLDVGDILFQTVRPYQMNNLYFDFDNDNYVASTGYAQIKSKINSKFLYHYLHYSKFVDNVLKRCTGTSYPAINANDLKKIKIKIPIKIDEQKKIGGIFDKLDLKIELLEKKYKYYQDFKKYLMQQIFAQKLRFADGTGEWNLFKLGDIVELMRNGSSENQVSFKTEFPVTRIETISKGILNFDKVGYVEKIDSSYLLQHGDILLSNINSLKYIGNCVFFDDDKTLYHGMNLMLIRFKEDFNKKYLFYYMKFYQQWFQKMACQAVNQASINQTSLKKFPFYIPPTIDEQNKIVNVIDNTDHKINSIGEQILKMKDFKKGLLQQMFV
jgi:type I restriction enzyme S subunit